MRGRLTRKRSEVRVLPGLPFFVPRNFLPVISYLCCRFSLKPATVHVTTPCATARVSPPLVSLTAILLVSRRVRIDADRCYDRLLGHEVHNRKRWKCADKAESDSQGAHSFSATARELHRLRRRIVGLRKGKAGSGKHP